MKISFSIPGVPMGKERVTTDGRSKRKFTPKKTADYEKLILQLWKVKAPRFQPHPGPVMLRCTAVFPIPVSWPKAVKEAAIRGEMFYLSRPDFDNCLKICADALTPPRGKDGIPADPFGYPWFDDGQVMGGCIKRYGSPARLDVTLEFFDQPSGIPTPSEAKREGRNIKAEQDRKSGKLGRTLTPHNAPSRKAPGIADTPLGRAIAAAIARDDKEPPK